MFGYVKTDIPNMYVKDTVLYKSAYCGLCKSIGRECGNKGRLCLNYDLTFLSLLAHNVLDVDLEINKERCVIHWFRKRPVAKDDYITKRIANLNIILAYHKLSDDVNDSNKGRLKRSFFKKSYKKAKKNEQEFDKIVENNYKILLDYEKKNGDSIDIASDSFGKMMKEISKELFGDKFNEELGALSYNLGKWIYLIDALDDFDKDKKNGEYNVFVNAYKTSTKRKELIEQNRSELELIFGTILSDINEANSKIKYNFNCDLINNVLLKGLRMETIRIMNMECKKCKTNTKF